MLSQEAQPLVPIELYSVCRCFQAKKDGLVTLEACDDVSFRAHGQYLTMCKT
jgi:hypothetical protein